MVRGFLDWFRDSTERNGVSVVGGLFTIPLDARWNGARKRSSSARSRAAPLLDAYIGDEANSLVEVAVADVVRATPQYSPITFVGRKGSGKSVLLQSLATRLLKVHSRQEVCVYSGADFSRAIGLAQETNDLTNFRERWRAWAAVMIDDLQQLVGKDHAQEELTYILDAFADPPRPLVLSLPRPAAEISGLQAGLVSRIQGGLVVPLHPPGPEARLEIVRRLTQAQQLNVSSEVLLVLGQHRPAEAEAIGSSRSSKALPAFKLPAFNVERTARMLKRLKSAAAELDPQPEILDLTQVREILGSDLFGTPPDLRSITSAVAKYFDQPVEDLHGPARRKELVRARGVAMYLARRLTGKSFSLVGKHFGNRDHTTVLHAYRKITDLVQHDAGLRKAVEDLTTQFSGT